MIIILHQVLFAFLIWILITSIYLSINYSNKFKYVLAYLKLIGWNSSNLISFISTNSNYNILIGYPLMPNNINSIYFLN